MMKFPPDWQDHSIYRFEGPEDDGIKHNIYVTIENDIDLSSLEEYAEINIKAVEKELQGYHELKSGPISMNNRIPAVEVVYKWCPAEDREVYQRVIYLLIDNNGYILTATFSKKTWKTIGHEVDKILRSFTIPKFEPGRK